MPSSQVTTTFRGLKHFTENLILIAVLSFRTEHSPDTRMVRLISLYGIARATGLKNLTRPYGMGYSTECFMSKDNNVDMDRYFNDPEYRKEIATPKKKRPLIPPKYQNIALRAGVALLIAIVGFVIYLFQGLPSIEELENPRTAIASEVRSRDGAVLDRYFIENRTHVSVDQISPNVLNALIATEDHRFRSEEHRVGKDSK